MIQVDPVKVMVNLSEKYLPLVREGMKATVSTDVYPELRFPGNRIQDPSHRECSHQDLYRGS